MAEPVSEQEEIKTGKTVAMSGLIKQKQYDWKDSNLALFGSDLEKNVKKDSAATEKAWKNAGSKVGLQIWRIVKFKVEDWPREDYGKFYNGDSYIILNTYKEEDGEELCFDVHFWIGQYSTQDEYGTAAYKTVELDTFLNDAPIQHREVQGHESELFKSYFDNITILKGGADTGFRHVKPEEYTPRLFHFCGTRKHVEIREVPRNKDRLDSGDVYILDLGLQIYQWNGSGSNKDERMKVGLQIYQWNGSGSNNDERMKWNGLGSNKDERMKVGLQIYQWNGSGSNKDERMKVGLQIYQWNGSGSNKDERMKWNGSDSNKDERMKVGLQIYQMVSVEWFRVQIYQDENNEKGGLQIYQWNGSGSNKDERMKAMQYCIKLKDERSGKASSEVLDEGSTDKDHEFYKALNEDDVPDEAKKYKAVDSQKELFRLSDASGNMKFSLSKKGQVTKTDLDSKDVFILDSKTALHVWIGKDTSVNERRNAMSYAHKYLQSTDHPFVSVSCLAEGMKSKSFELALAA
ncbi:GSN [Mytilus coruscus]|uniref:Actin-modulator n=1 Tax=Mytilus coruscus TaxID=42192 RepID=A0A6J8DP00_MYTCO|nr:GSN [Mytilus coruscus]